MNWKKRAFRVSRSAGALVPAGCFSVGAGDLRQRYGPSGAPVPGATVDAASPALIEQRRTVVTNDAGRYSIVNLTPGAYTVTITRSGF